MEQQRIQMDQEKLCCLICLKDPVTITCGHIYCMNCIKDYWDEEDQTEIGCSGENTMLADLVEELKKTRLQAAPVDHCYAGPGDVACDFCTGRKLKATKSCLQCLVSYCEQHLQPHYESPAFEKHKLVDPSKKLQDNICSHHDEVMKIFCRTDQQCICYLCSMDEHKGHDTVSAAAQRTKRQRELGVSQQKLQRGIQDREKDVKLLQQEVEAINHSTDSRINIRPVRHFKDVMDKLQDILCDVWNNISLTVTEVDVFLPKLEPKTRAEFLEYSCQMTMDPNTAHTQLLLSEGNKKATVKREKQSYPEHPDRFTKKQQVMSRESLTGRCYWEVEWSGCEDSVAVTYRNISRTGSESEFGINYRSWVLEYSTNRYEFIHNNIRTFISGPQSSRIGVYLDHSAGILSFYSVSETMTLLHRVQTTFTQPLYAGLSVYGYGNTVELCELK